MNLNKSLAIVGSSHLSEINEMDARKMIAIILQEKEVFGSMIVTGDAKGIDAIAYDVARTMGYDTTMVIAPSKTWESTNGVMGFKERNLKIAELANEVLCIATRVKKTPCYHCNTGDHERTGGCFTLKQAKLMGKYGRLYIL